MPRAVRGALENKSTKALSQDTGPELSSTSAKCVLEQVIEPSVPQFPHLQNGPDHSSYTLLNEIIHLKPFSSVPRTQ